MKDSFLHQASWAQKGQVSTYSYSFGNLANGSITDRVVLILVIRIYS